MEIAERSDDLGLDTTSRISDMRIGLRLWTHFNWKFFFDKTSRYEPQLPSSGKLICYLSSYSPRKHPSLLHLYNGPILAWGIQAAVSAHRPIAPFSFTYLCISTLSFGHVSTEINLQISTELIISFLDKACRYWNSLSSMMPALDQKGSRRGTVVWVCKLLLSFQLWKTMESIAGDCCCLNILISSYLKLNWKTFHIYNHLTL